MIEYILIFWPWSQDYMDEPWFKVEASLADEKFGSAAYFIPKHRLEQCDNENSKI
jgi:hypothetical protein